MGVTDSAHTHIVEARWPDGARCPICGTDRVLARGLSVNGWRRWRCGLCRRDFSAITGTRLSGTKLSPQQWWAAVCCDGSRESIVSAAGVSQVTARRVARLLSPLRRRSARARLRHLLGEPSDAQREGFSGFSACEARVLNVMRTKLLGADAPLIASLAAVSLGHTRRCLRRLGRAGLVEPVDTDRSGAARVGGAGRLWRLAAGSARIVEHLPDLPEAPSPSGDRIPVEFWDCFWSGLPAQRLSVRRDALYIGEALINGRDVHARAWALAALPVSSLIECRKLRGCDTGTPARWLDCAIRERARSCATMSTSQPSTP